VAFLGPQAGKTIIGAIAITLEGAFKIKRNEFLEAAGRSRGMPIKNHVSAGLARDPQITLRTLSVPGSRYLIGVSSTWIVAATHDGGFNLLVDRIKPVARRGPSSAPGWPEAATPGADSSKSVLVYRVEDDRKIC